MTDTSKTKDELIALLETDIENYDKKLETLYSEVEKILNAKKEKEEEIKTLKKEQSDAYNYYKKEKDSYWNRIQKLQSELDTCKCGEKRKLEVEDIQQRKRQNSI